MEGGREKEEDGDAKKNSRKTEGKRVKMKGRVEGGDGRRMEKKISEKVKEEE